MSLRWRLCVSSTLVLAILVALTSTAAYITVRQTLYQTIDRSLVSQSEANLHYLSRIGAFTPGTNISSTQFGSAVFTYIYPGGQLAGNMQVPITEAFLSKARDGQEVWGYASLNGSRARVYYAPFVRTGPETGEKVVLGVLMAASSLELPDQIMNAL